MQQQPKQKSKSKTQPIEKRSRNAKIDARQNDRRHKPEDRRHKMDRSTKGR